MDGIKKGCDFCNDMRYIEPAGLIACKDKDIQEKINSAHNRKIFLLIAEGSLWEVKKCPRCGYKFTEEDYDSYFN